MPQEEAIFAGGCFWCTEAVFGQLTGVHSVVSGYIGGHTVDPTYKEVCGGSTGHAEAIRIAFDAEVISYADLLEIFFATHDPTQLNRQGNDIGTQLMKHFRGNLISRAMRRIEAALNETNQKENPCEPEETA